MVKGVIISLPVVGRLSLKSQWIIGFSDTLSMRKI